MNYSKAIFIINPNVRAMVGIYETGNGAKRESFKTLDMDIRVDDLVVVPTDSRHGFTVVKIIEADVDIDIEAADETRWIVSKIEISDFKKLKVMEDEGIKAIKSAELRKKREDLQRTMLADHMATIKTLDIASIGSDAGLPPPQSPPDII